MLVRRLTSADAAGFRAFGTEPEAIKVGDRFLGKVHMARSVGSE